MPTIVDEIRLYVLFWGFLSPDLLYLSSPHTHIVWGESESSPGDWIWVARLLERAGLVSRP